MCLAVTLFLGLVPSTHPGLNTGHTIVLEGAGTAVLRGTAVNEGWPAL